jgi:hypothetical protein
MITTWKTRLAGLRLEQLILETVLVYFTLHLLEEGLFNFAAWVEMCWRIPGYTVSKWLLHNLYFISCLGIGYLLYRHNPQKYLQAGLGITLWGVMNAISHIIFSLIYLEYSPGLLTGILFLGLGVLIIREVRREIRLTPKRVALAILAGLL